MSSTVSTFPCWWSHKEAPMVEYAPGWVAMSLTWTRLVRMTLWCSMPRNGQSHALTRASHHQVARRLLTRKASRSRVQKLVSALVTTTTWHAQAPSTTSSPFALPSLQSPRGKFPFHFFVSYLVVGSILSNTTRLQSLQSWPKTIIVVVQFVYYIVFYKSKTLA